MVSGVSIYTYSTGYLFSLTKFSQVNEDLVRYMKAASIYNNTFLVDDPIWAEDFAPNGEFDTSKGLRHCLQEIQAHCSSSEIPSHGNVMQSMETVP